MAKLSRLWGKQTGGSKLVSGFGTGPEGNLGRSTSNRATDGKNVGPLSTTDC